MTKNRSTSQDPQFYLPFFWHNSFILDDLKLAELSNNSFYRATLCVSAVFAVVRCPSVCHVGVLYPDGWRYRQTSFSAR